MKFMGVARIVQQRFAATTSKWACGTPGCELKKQTWWGHGLRLYSTNRHLPCQKDGCTLFSQSFWSYEETVWGMQTAARVQIEARDREFACCKHIVACQQQQQQQRQQQRLWILVHNGWQCCLQLWNWNTWKGMKQCKSYSTAFEICISSKTDEELSLEMLSSAGICCGNQSARMSEYYISSYSP